MYIIKKALGIERNDDCTLNLENAAADPHLGIYQKTL